MYHELNYGHSFLEFGYSTTGSWDNNGDTSCVKMDTKSAVSEIALTKVHAADVEWNKNWSFVDG